MFVFAERRRFDLHARLFAVESVENTDGQREHCSAGNVTRGKKHRN
jgi:hypothetical protein